MKPKITKSEIETHSPNVWNKFIDSLMVNTGKNISKLELTHIQKVATLCFWYDAEMNSGGHSEWFDCYSDVKSQDLIKAIDEIGAKKCSENLIKAIKIGEDDDYMETDSIFYELEEDFNKKIEQFVYKNINEFFDVIID